MKIILTYKTGKIEKFCNCSRVENEKDTLLILKKDGSLKAMRFKNEIKKIDFKNGGK